MTVETAGARSRESGPALLTPDSDFVQQHVHKSQRGLRRRVAAIQPRVNRDGDASPAAQFDGREQVLVERMYAAGADQPHHVQRAVLPTRVFSQLDESGDAKELTRLDRL